MTLRLAHFDLHFDLQETWQITPTVRANVVLKMLGFRMTLTPRQPNTLNSYPGLIRGVMIVAGSMDVQ